MSGTSWLKHNAAFCNPSHTTVGCKESEDEAEDVSEDILYAEVLWNHMQKNRMEDCVRLGQEKKDDEKEWKANCKADQEGKPSGILLLI